MNTIATVETAMLDAAKAATGNTLQVIESIGGGWTLANLKRALQRAPGVYVAFQGAKPEQAPYLMELRYSLYIVTKGAQEVNRRHGSPRMIGAYDLLAQILPALDGLVVASTGTLRAKGIDNLFREAMFELGGTVYALQFAMPNAAFDPQPAETLDDFITFDAIDDIAPDDPNNPTAEDTVTLPAASDTGQEPTP